MKSYTYSFTTHKLPSDIFDFLLNVNLWWVGFYQETITGNSQNVNDEFSFSAGGGMHFTKQKLTELIPSQKVVWEVIESRLTFLNNPKEWEHTKLIFDITPMDNEAKVTFTHEGLKPQIECYNQCSLGWTQYLKKLEKQLTIG